MIVREAKRILDTVVTSRPVRVPLRWALASRRTETTVLCYHDIGDRAAPGVVSWDGFREQMDYLQANYRIVSLAEVVRRVELGGDGDPDEVALTFDDGWRRAVESAAPFLNTNGMPFTLFVVKNFCEQEREQRRYARVDELLDCVGEFGLIGGHGTSHWQPLTKLDDEALRMEIRGSWSLLDRLGVRPEDRFFCYPWARHDLRVESACAEEGFRAAFGAPWKRFVRRTDLFRLGRVTIDHDDDLASFRRKLRGARDWQGAVGFSGKTLRPWVR